MQTNNNNTTKRRSVIAGLMLMIIIIIGSTFAFQLLNQAALSPDRAESQDFPSGRIHNIFQEWDDFTATQGHRNKNVFAENFGDTPIGVRVQFLEFLELDNVGFSNLENNYIPMNINDITTWSPFLVDDGLNRRQGTTAYEIQNQGIIWVIGQSEPKVFMPTFNHINRPLEINNLGITVSYNSIFSDPFAYSFSDASGRAVESRAGGFQLNNNSTITNIDDISYQGVQTGIDGHTGHRDYWQPSQEIQSNRYFINDEGNLDFELATHQARMTPPTDSTYTSNGVMSLSAWRNAGRPTGNFWIADTSNDDGWFIWNGLIPPFNAETGQSGATSLLMESTYLPQHSNLEYVIHIEAEFFTPTHLPDSPVVEEIVIGPPAPILPPNPAPDINCESITLPNDEWECTYPPLAITGPDHTNCSDLNLSFGWTCEDTNYGPIITPSPPIVILPPEGSGNLTCPENLPTGYDCTENGDGSITIMPPPGSQTTCNDFDIAPNFDCEQQTPGDPIIIMPGFDWSLYTWSHSGPTDPIIIQSGTTTNFVDVETIVSNAPIATGGWDYNLFEGGVVSFWVTGPTVQVAIDLGFRCYMMPDGRTARLSIPPFMPNHNISVNFQFVPQQFDGIDPWTIIGGGNIPHHLRCTDITAAELSAMEALELPTELHPALPLTSAYEVIALKDPVNTWGSIDVIITVPVIVDGWPQLPSPPTTADTCESIINRLGEEWDCVYDTNGNPSVSGPFQRPSNQPRPFPTCADIINNTNGMFPDGLPVGWICTEGPPMTFVPGPGPTLPAKPDTSTTCSDANHGSEWYCDNGDGGVNYPAFTGPIPNPDVITCTDITLPPGWFCGNNGDGTITIRPGDGPDLDNIPSGPVTCEILMQFFNPAQWECRYGPNGPELIWIGGGSTPCDDLDLPEGWTCEIIVTPPPFPRPGAYCNTLNLGPEWECEDSKHGPIINGPFNRPENTPKQPEDEGFLTCSDIKLSSSFVCIDGPPMTIMPEAALPSDPVVIPPINPGDTCSDLTLPSGFTCIDGPDGPIVTAPPGYTCDLIVLPPGFECQSGPPVQIRPIPPLIMDPITPDDTCSELSLPNGWTCVDGPPMVVTPPTTPPWTCELITPPPGWKCVVGPKGPIIQRIITLRINPTSGTLNDTNLSISTTVEGTALGDILITGLPTGVTYTIVNNTITFTTNRDENRTTGANPALVQIIRDGINVTFSLTLDVTRDLQPLPTPLPTGNQCPQTGMPANLWIDSTGFQWCVVHEHGNYSMLVARYAIQHNRIDNNVAMANRNHSSNAFQPWPTTTANIGGPEARGRMQTWFNRNDQVSLALRNATVNANLPTRWNTVGTSSAARGEDTLITSLSTPVTGSHNSNNPVFFLNEAEINVRLGQNGAGAQTSRVTNRLNVNGSIGAAAWYWLRSAGPNATNPVSMIHADGSWWSLNPDNVTTAAASFRPAIWISTTALGGTPTPVRFTYRIRHTSTGTLTANRGATTANGPQSTVVVERTTNNWATFETVTTGNISWSISGTAGGLAVDAQNTTSRISPRITATASATTGSTRSLVASWTAPATATNPGVLTSARTINVPTPTVTVTCDSNGGSFVGNATNVIPGTTGTAGNWCSTPTRAGHVFTGWTPTGTRTITSNTTFTANWQVLLTGNVQGQFIVSHGGMGSTGFNVSLNSPIRAGFTATLSQNRFEANSGTVTVTVRRDADGATRTTTATVQRSWASGSTGQPGTGGSWSVSFN